jgi:hypothetical protein
MNHAFGTVPRLALTALLLSAISIAPAAAKDTKNKSTEHHSKFSKVAFWRHHNDTNKSAKHESAKPATSKQAQPQAAQVKPAVAKQSQASKTQVKAVSAKQPAQKKQATKAITSSAPKTTSKVASAQPKKSPQKSTTARNIEASQKD